MVLPSQGGRKGRCVMNMDIENIVYTDYTGHVKIDEDALIVSMWNKYIEGENNDNKVFRNTPENFNEKFKNPYDAAWAVGISRNWRWTDEYAYFDDEGYLTSFSHWDEETSPIQIDKIDISNLINLKKGYVDNIPVNNIPRAIHDALKEV